MAANPTRPILPVLVALLLAAAGCQSTGVSVRSTHDPEVDFSAVRTFAWASVPPQARTAVRNVSLIELLSEQLAASGLTQVEQGPDVRIAVHRSLAGSLNTRRWGYTMETGRLGYYTLQEGTLVVDMIDAATKRNIWRGTAEGAFRFDDDPDRQVAEVRALLAEMFADFPPDSN